MEVMELNLREDLSSRSLWRFYNIVIDVETLKIIEALGQEGKTW